MNYAAHTHIHYSHKFFSRRKVALASFLAYSLRKIYCFHFFKFGTCIHSLGAKSREHSELEEIRFLIHLILRKWLYTGAHFHCLGGRALFSWPIVVVFFLWSLTYPICWHNSPHCLVFPSSLCHYTLSAHKPTSTFPSPIRMKNCIFSNTTFPPMCCGESMFHPRLWNGTKTRLDCRWTATNSSLKMSHDCVCGKLSANAATSLHSSSDLWKLKPLSNVIGLWLSRFHVLSISDLPTLYRVFLLVQV